MPTHSIIPTFTLMGAMVLIQVACLAYQVKRGRIRLDSRSTRWGLALGIALFFGGVLVLEAVNPA